MKYGILDSGFGGLSVLFKIVKNRYSGEFYYLGDNNNAPYGEKSSRKLKKITDKNIKLFLDLGITNIIVACNTISTTLEKYLKNKYKFIKFYFISPNLNFFKEKDEICYVLSTKKTAKNLKKQGVISKNIKIISCSGLVELIEDKLFNVSIEEISRFLPSREPNFVYLGCTHYPFVSTQIKRVYKKAKIFDGIEQFLSNINFVNDEKNIEINFIGECSCKNSKIFSILEKNYKKWQ